MKDYQAAPSCKMLDEMVLVTLRPLSGQPIVGDDDIGIIRRGIHRIHSEGMGPHYRIKVGKQRVLEHGVDLQRRSVTARRKLNPERTFAGPRRLESLRAHRSR